MAKSPEEMAAAMKANLPEKTGKSLPQWLEIVAAANLEKHGQIVKLLKQEHGMTHGYANLVAHEALSAAKPVEPAEEDPIALPYKGKEHLAPIRDALLEAAKSFGDDVELAPKKTYLSLRRSKQFAILCPSTKKRFDLGLSLKGRAAEGRLEESGKWNSMVSHRVRLSEVAEVDEAVLGWLREAYEGS